MTPTRNRFRTLLLSGVVATALVGTVPARADDVARRDKLWGPRGLWIAAEGAFLFASGAAQPWGAVPTSSSVQPQDLLELDPANVLGGKIQIGYRFRRGFDVAVSLRGLTRSKRTDAVDGPTVNLGPDYMPPIVFDVLGPVKGYYSFASVESRSNLHVVDFEVGYDVGLGDRTRLRLFGGVRYARYTSDTTFVGGFYDVPDLTTISLDSKTWGIGPRLGVDAKYRLKKAGRGLLFLVGSLSGALLFGRTRSNGTRTATGFNPYPGTSSFGSEKSNTVFNIEFKLGVSYAFPIGRWAGSVTLGYGVDVWLNLVNTRGADGALGPGGIIGSQNQYRAGAGTTGGDRIYHGPFVTLQINF